jgi:hypothetical protein
VQPHTWYELSAKVRATAKQPVPAVLALDGDDDTTTDPITANGQWQERDLYFNSSAATKVSLVLSLGWFGDMVSGDADFDDLQLEKVVTVPPGAAVAGRVAAPLVTAGPSKITLPLVAVLVLLIVGCGPVLLRGDRGE